MNSAFEMEVLTVTLELSAASGEVMHRVRSGKAFGPAWTAASDRQNRAFKKWRKVIDRPSAPGDRTCAKTDRSSSVIPMPAPIVGSES